MENARPSSLRGDIWPRCDRALLRRREFTSGRRSATGRVRRALFVWRRRPVLPYLHIAVVRQQNSLDAMDVSGTIGAILSQKSKDIFFIRSDALVSEAIEMMDEKNVGALLVM